MSYPVPINPAPIDPTETDEMEQSRSEPFNIIRSGGIPQNLLTSANKLCNSSVIKWSNLPPLNNQFNLDSPQGIPAEIEGMRIDHSNGFNTMREPNFAENELLKVEINKQNAYIGMKNHEYNQEITRMKQTHERQNEAIHQQYAFCNPMLAKDENQLNSKDFY